MIKEGDKVYIIATVTKPPEKDRNMIRCITENQEVIWVTKQEIVTEDEIQLL